MLAVERRRTLRAPLDNLLVEIREFINPDGMVERFNRRISEIVNQTRFRSAAELDSPRTHHEWPTTLSFSSVLANVIANVIADVVGETGQKMLRAVVAEERDCAGAGRDE